MANMIVTYYLSEEGQKVAIRNGLDAKKRQTVIGEVHSMLTHLPCVTVTDEGYLTVGGDNAEAKYVLRALKNVDAPITDIIKMVNFIHRSRDEYIAKSIEQVNVDARKLRQLTDAVERLGTETQKEKWKAGLMVRREALNLILDDERMILNGEGLDWIAEEAMGEEDEFDSMPCGHTDFTSEINDKETLTDGEFEILSCLKRAVASKNASISIKIRIRKCVAVACASETTEDRTTFALVSWRVGEYDVKTFVFLQ